MLAQKFSPKITTSTTQQKKGEKMKTLVKGFTTAVYNENEGDYFEVLYAVYPDGKIMKSDEHRHSSTFKGTWGWNEVDYMPYEAEYCGNYYM